MDKVCDYSLVVFIFQTDDLSVAVHVTWTTVAIYKGERVKLIPVIVL